MSNPQVIRKVEKNIINPADMIDYGHQFVWNMIDKSCLPADFNINAISYYQNPSTNETTVVVGGSINNDVSIAFTTTFGTSNEWTVVNGFFTDVGFITSITRDDSGEFMFVGKYLAESGSDMGFIITCNISTLNTTKTNYKLIVNDSMLPLLSIAYNHKENEFVAVGEQGKAYIIKPSTTSPGYSISNGIPILDNNRAARFITYDPYNNMYIGCGDNEYIFYGKYDSDGDLYWNSYKITDNSNIALHSITYDAKRNRYTAVGSNGYMVYNTTIISNENWKQTYIELPAASNSSFQNDLRAVYYSSKFDIYVCAGYNDIIGCNRNFDYLWSIDILSVPPSTSYQNIVEHPTFGIIVVGGNSTILYSNKLIRLVRPKSTDDILQTTFGIGSIIISSNNEYPANYLWFGSWEFEPSENGMYVYTRVAQVISETMTT